MRRRTFHMTTGKTADASLATRLQAADAAVLAARIKHSVCKWF